MAITSVDVLSLTAPLDRPISTSFGAMHQRNAVLVGLRDERGITGWGESWTNFPGWSGQERVAILTEALVPQVLGREAADVETLYDELSHRLRHLMVQWGAPGPIHQALSAIDCALWDLHARLLDLPLHHLLGGDTLMVPIYASGLGPVDPVGTSRWLADLGVDAFKLKVGFGIDTDRRNLHALRSAYGAGATIMVDANRAWNHDAAVAMLDVLETCDVRWLEEPLDGDDEALVAFRNVCSLDVAAGENVYGLERYERLLEDGAVDVIQPDVTKNGGITTARRVCQRAVALGKAHALHFLGNAPGQRASAHLFAAEPGGVFLEFDANANPVNANLLRTDLPITEGHLDLRANVPGIGWEPDSGLVERHLAARRTLGGRSGYLT